ncbi:uncharacterized protein JCM15063_005048 [Sporobolomyces koalae]|uniref:uncharacterized protein n=1 Tax=Sporobolomyces koalae TaxID=500713 RepID=UPI00317A1D57
MAENSENAGTASQAVKPITTFVHATPAVTHERDRRTVKSFIRSKPGRDSVLRSLQYVLRLVIIYKLRKGRRPRTNVLATAFSLVSLLSAIRRVLALEALWTSLSYSALNGRTVSLDILHRAFDLIATVSDNMYLLIRLGLFPSRSTETTRRIDKVSDWATLGSIVVQSVQIYRQTRTLKTRMRATRTRVVRDEQRLEHLLALRAQELQDAHLPTEEHELRTNIRIERTRGRRDSKAIHRVRWTRIKLAFEAVFALYDAFDLELGREWTLGTTGAFASLIDQASAQVDGASPVPSTSQLPLPPPRETTAALDTANGQDQKDPKGKGKSTSRDDSTLHEDRHDEDESATGDPEEDILIAVVPKANINGLKYSGGIRTLKEGMQLEVRRDKYNANDKNAIEVRHVRGLRVGFVAKVLAARLAPLINERKIRLQATSGPVPQNVTGIAAVPMRLEIHGKRKYAKDERLDWAFPERVEKLRIEKEKRKLLKEAQEQVDKEEDEQDNGVAQNEPSKSKSKARNDVAMTHAVLLERKSNPTGDVLSSMFSAGSMDPSSLPVHPCPPGRQDGTMKANLMEFQKQGLAWMIKMEHPSLPKTVDDPPVQLWSMKKDEEGKTFWHNVGTGSNQREKPILKRGGILADEMGLGKTMQTIALVCTDDTGEGVLKKPEEPDERFDDMTLIVCPLSVASNWTDQFQQHVGKKRMNWHFYHGEGRDLTKKQLREFDVVITTYQSLVAGIEEVAPKPRTREEEEELAEGIVDVADHPPPSKKQKRTVKDGTLHAIKWRRIVIDEGHLIKNPKAKMSRAAAELTAERRWILTGTPIVNAAADLGAMIHFLRICKPLDDPEVWKRYVPMPRKEKGQPPPDPDPEVAKLLRAVVLSSTLRRTKNMVDKKGQPLVKLPELAMYQIKVKLTGAARETYDEVFKQLGKIIGGMVKQNSGGTKYSQMLSYLLRLRQIACDPTLCPQDFIEMIRDKAQAEHLDDEFKSVSGESETPQQMNFLRSLLRQLDEEECSVCSSIVVDARITICQHIFCQSCIEYAVETSASCPVCFYPLTAKGIVGPERSVTPASSTSRGASVGAVERSAKTTELIQLLKNTPPGVKTLVFSQWTSHLDRIEAALTEEGMTTCRFDGSMRQDKREQVIKSFTLPNKDAVAGSKADKRNPMVMLLSLKAGALGLNLTIASQVVLMDPWWQPAIEQQAIDRVNRIGQTQKVRVFQMVAENTVEDKVLEIQAGKEKLIAEAFSGNRGVEQGRQKIDAKLNDIAKIFGLT